ncbi:MAG: alpha-galactosidase [Clostridia bacterium]|nr:alpha-galactosidase [Clostridia bacterium]
MRLSWPVSLDEEAMLLGDAWERSYGDLVWRRLIEKPLMPWYMMVCENGLTHGFGVETGCASLAHWETDGKTVTLTLIVRNGWEGVRLNGRKLLAATVLCREGQTNETPFEATKAFCHLMCQHPRMPKEPVYGINNWYYAHGVSSEEEILRDADYLKPLVEDEPVRPFVVIDDGWQICHTTCCSGGPWDRSNYRFPDMKALADKIKARGMRPGIWFRPLLTSECYPDECYLERDWENTDPGNMSQRMLDPSHPYVLDKVREMMRGLSAWGYELIKHDLSTFDILGCFGYMIAESMPRRNWHFYDRSLTTAEVVLNFYRALREGAGDDVLILGCNTLSHLSAGIFDMQRIGGDVSDKEWSRAKRLCVNTLAFRLPQHGAFYAVDADCVGITPRIPWEKNVQWMRLLAESHTPMFLSIDVEHVTPNMTADIKKAIQVFLTPAVPSLEPLEWSVITCPERWKTSAGEMSFLWE